MGIAVCHVAYCTVGYPSEFRVYEVKQYKYEVWLWTLEAKIEDMGSKKKLPIRLSGRTWMTLNEGKALCQKTEDYLCRLWQNRSSQEGMSLSPPKCSEKATDLPT